MKVVFIDSVHESLAIGLQQLGYQCVMAYNEKTDVILKELADATGVVIRSKFRLSREVMEAAPRLKFIARSGSGMENIDVAFAQSRGILCINSPEGNRDAVAEHALGMLLMLFNKLKQCDAEVRAGLWRREENRGLEILGKTVGIIGYGVMGSAFAQRLQGFGCRIMAYDKYKTGFGNSLLQEVSLKEIMEQSDILSLHVPLTAETQFMVNQDFFKGFKKPFYLINTSRGKVVNTLDLCQAIESGKVLGACLDVLEFEQSSFEKIEENEVFKRLCSFSNVLLSPHVAGWTVESYEKLSTYLLEKIKAAFHS
jgi:D-3-phosphoglycerate dehydrogenase